MSRLSCPSEINVIERPQGKGGAPWYQPNAVDTGACKANGVTSACWHSARIPHSRQAKTRTSGKQMRLDN